MTSINYWHKMKLSIIIPVYNVASYIVRCLQSVVTQKNITDMEVILVDDCGTDDSIVLAETFLSEYKEIDYRILHHAKNGGLSAARNTGLKAAKGEYVYFLDSDDALMKDALIALMRPLDECRYDLVIGDYVTHPNQIPASMLVLPEGAVMGQENVLQAYAEGLWYVMAWNKLCRRKFLVENHLFFDEGLLHEDVIWTFKVACKVSSLYVVKQPTYMYSIREASIMTGMTIDKDASIYVKAFDKIADFIESEHREFGKNEYSIFYGKRAGILYSLLQKGEITLYEKYYPMFYKQCYLSPWKAFRKKIIFMGYLIRDMHYLLPMSLGKWYMRFFYSVCYKWRGKQIEGAVWG